MNVIKKVTVVNPQGNIVTKVGKKNVARIEDKSQEFENGTEFIYLCFDSNDNLVRSIENCPVIVDYEV